MLPPPPRRRRPGSPPMRAPRVCHPSLRPCAAQRAPSCSCMGRWWSRVKRAMQVLGRGRMGRDWVGAVQGGWDEAATNTGATGCRLCDLPGRGPLRHRRRPQIIHAPPRTPLLPWHALNLQPKNPQRAWGFHSTSGRRTSLCRRSPAAPLRPVRTKEGPLAPPPASHLVDPLAARH